MKTIPMCLLTLCLATSATAQVNDCTDPYWADSLRCRTVPPGVAPQPNENSVPLSAAQVHTFTRVFLDADDSIRCLDGTRPVIYVDKAVTGESNNWIFTMVGGGSTATADTNADGVPDDAQRVADVYADPAEHGEMTTAYDPPMKELEGIHDPDPVRNPVFSGYNRVRIEKCGYDRYMGRAAYEAAGGFFIGETWPPTGLPIDFNVYQQGYLMMLEAFDALAPGLTYTTWTVDAQGLVVEADETLPALSLATKILLVGHSGGAHGLMHNIDNLAVDLTPIAPEADVRALFDANFLPSNENEVAFNAGGDAYDHVWSGVTVGALNNITYDGALYWPTSFMKTSYDMVQAELDASCLATHPLLDDWRCTDRHHVLLNHIATPFFFREDFRDPNPEHLNFPIGHEIKWADCPILGATCFPLLNVAEYRARLTEQFETMLYQSQIDSELATGADPSVGAGNFPTWYAWMPQCQVHEGAYNTKQFFGTRITYGPFVHTMRSWLEGFMSVGRLNLRGSRVDGWAGMTTTCPP